jgi:hypothetical protein
MLRTRSVRVRLDVVPMQSVTHIQHKRDKGY